MAEGQVPEQAAIDDVRREARLEALRALDDLIGFLRSDEALGGVDAIRIGVLSQQVAEKTRLYRIAVNIGAEPGERTRLNEAELERPRGVGPRHRRRQRLSSVAESAPRTG